MEDVMTDESRIDIYRVIKDHRSRHQEDDKLENISSSSQSRSGVIFSDIPDIFFDRILVDIKLNRYDTLILMYLYRRIWCRPNLYQKHGISQMLSLGEMAKLLNIEMTDVYQSLRKLEGFGLLKTIRSGQYFIRRYFLKEYDQELGQKYDDFDI